MKKRVWSVLLALCMIFALLPLGAQAADLSVTEPYRKLLSRVLSGDTGGGNGVFAFVDGDEVPELLYYCKYHDGSGDVYFYTLDGTEPKYLLKADVYPCDLSFSSDSYQAISIVRYRGEVRIMAMKSDYYRDGSDA